MGDIKDRDIDLILTDSRRRELIREAGYAVDEEGYLIDKETDERVKAEDGKEINILEDKQFAIISGSHIFVRNIAGYSHILTKRGVLKILPEK